MSPALQAEWRATMLLHVYLLGDIWHCEECGNPLHPARSFGHHILPKILANFIKFDPNTEDNCRIRCHSCEFDDWLADSSHRLSLMLFYAHSNKINIQSALNSARAMIKKGELPFEIVQSIFPIVEEAIASYKLRQKETAACRIQMIHACEVDKYPKYDRQYCDGRLVKKRVVRKHTKRINHRFGTFVSA